MGYPDVPVREMMRRTKANLDVINDLHEDRNLDDSPEVYEVTQLVNSFLGAWAHPWEAWQRELRRKTLEEAEELGWPIKRPDDDRDDEPRDLGQLLSWVRNAMAHGNIRYLRDDSNPDEIGKVSIWNEWKRYRTWGITLTIAELSQFLKCFLALAEQLPEPRPRSLRHIRDRQVNATRTVSIPNSKELRNALYAYGQDHGIGSGFDEIVEAALRDILDDRGYLVPFRPFQVTPLHRDEGPTDVSVNHDRHFTDRETSGSH